MHFVFEEFFFVNRIIHVDLLLIVAKVVHLLAHDYLLRRVLLVPVYNEQVQAHTEEAVDDLETVEHFLDRVVVREVVDQVFIFVAFAVVFEYAVEVAPVDHRHGSVTIRVAAVAVEAVSRRLEPIVALFLQRSLIHEYVIKHRSNLEKLQRIQQFAEGKFLFPENNASLNYNN